MNTYARHNEVYTPAKIKAASAQFADTLRDICAAAQADGKRRLLFINGGGGAAVNGAFADWLDHRTVLGTPAVVHRVEELATVDVPADAFTVVCVDGWTLDETVGFELTLGRVQGFDAALTMRSNGVWGMYSALTFDVVAPVVDELEQTMLHS